MASAAQPRHSWVSLSYAELARGGEAPDSSLRKEAVASCLPWETREHCYGVVSVQQTAGWWSGLREEMSTEGSYFEGLVPSVQVGASGR